jgi:membrane protein
MARLSFKTIIYLIKETIKEFNEDNAIYYSASLSYYTIFSLPPIIIIIVSVAGSLFGKETISSEIYHQFSSLLGPQGAQQIESMVRGAQKIHSNLLATFIGIGTLIFASTGVFIAIQTSLNVIWDVKAKPKSNIIKLIKDRILSFALIITLAFLLLVSLVIHALLVAIIDLFSQQFENVTILLIQLTNFIVPLFIITLLFAVIFKFLPDAKIHWRDVWTGSLFTSLLFTLGKFLIGLYLGNSNIGSVYGAAGTVILILLWVFYSSIILFFGAEFTQVYAKTYGNKIEPSQYAVKVERKVIEKKSSENNFNTDNKS